MEEWRLDTFKAFVEEKGQHVLSVRKIATKHDIKA